jgi:hypothetical protein
MAVPDPFGKTVRIPVRFRNGVLRFRDGSPLPELKENAVGELVVPAYCVEDRELALTLNAETEVPFLKSGDLLLVGVTPPRTREDKPLSKSAGEYLAAIQTKYSAGQGSRLPMNHAGSQFVEVRLLEDMQLLLRGTKRPSLLPCQCKIPHLQTEVASLNQAYSRISEVFEPHRRSHSGNVFRLCYFLDSVSGQWRKLAALRSKLEAECRPA